MKAWWRPVRRGAEAVELLDAGVGTAEEIRECYDALERVNRFLSGYRSTFAPLRDLLPDNGTGPRIEVLDVAGGDGAYARRFWNARVTLLDLNQTTLEIARQRSPGVGLVRGDALRLPFGDACFDVSHSSTFFHHLSIAAAAECLAELCRVSRRFVVVNDLVRSYIAAGSIWSLTRLFSSSQIVQHDGPLSVLKAFIPDELMSIARAVSSAGATQFRWSVRRTFPYRMTLLGVRLATPREVQ